MDKEQESEKYNMVEGRKTMYPPALQKLVVEEVSSGRITIPQAVEKYNLRSGRTVRNWIAKVSSNPKQKRSSISTIIQARREVSEGILSVHEASVKYQITDNTIRRWMVQYSKEIGKKYNLQTNTDMKPDMNFEDTHRLKELEKSLELAQLKISGLQIMIDLAEEEFKIDIRKKSGSKPLA